MNLFAEIEGLRGENLSSALLRFILMRSQDARTKLAELLSGQGGESFSAMHRFACLLEGGTQDETHGSGRIDLLIEMDDALVGIENKFNAGFQDGQPHKYLDFLIKRAAQLSEGGFISKNRVLLVILAPDARRSEIQNSIAKLPRDQQRICRFLSWESVLAALLEVVSTQDSKTREVIVDFSVYVNRYLKQSFFHKGAQWLRSLENWSRYGSERQRQVVSELSEFFPSVSGKPSQGDNWRGYYFGERGWFGFVEETTISTGGQAERPRRNAEFVVVISFDPIAEPDGDCFHKIKMTNQGFCGAPEKMAWVVDVEKLTSRESWVSALKPIVDRTVVIC